MRCVDDEDVIGAGVFDQVALIVVSAGCPVASERADLLGDSQVTRAVESKDLIGAICGADRKFCRGDSVGHRGFDRTIDLFLQLLRDKGQTVQRIFVAFSWKRIIRNVVGALCLGKLALDDHGLAVGRRVAAGESNIATRCRSSARDGVVRGQRLCRFRTVCSSDDDRQIRVSKNLEVIGKDGRAAIGTKADLVAGGGYCH